MADLFLTDNANHRIMKRDSSDLSYVAKIGSSGSGNDQFSLPTGITTDGVSVWVCDTGNNRIVRRLASDLSYNSQYGTAGSGQDNLSSPSGVSYSNGYLYIADFGNARIMVRDATDFAYVRQLAMTDVGLTAIRDVAADNNYLYVANGFDYCFSKYNLPTLTYLGRAGTFGANTDGLFEYVNGIGTDGLHVYVVDDNGDGIHKYLGDDMSFVSRVGGSSTRGSGNDQFANPKSVIPDGAGYIYIADATNDRIKKQLSTTLVYDSKIGTLGTGDDQFDDVNGVGMVTAFTGPPASFGGAKVELVGRSKLSIYLSKEIDGTKLIAQINGAVGSYLFNAYDGKYRYVLYEQLSGSASMSFTDEDIFSIEEVTDSQDIISQVKASYRHRLTRDYWNIYIYERTQAQYLRGSPTPLTKELELPYTQLTDAQLLAQRTALYEGERIRTFKITVSHRGWKLLPSEFIQITSIEMDVNATLEILEVEPDFLGNTTTLVVSGQRGLVDGTGNPGFWWGTTGINNSVFPASLGGASTDPWSSGWTEAQKAWARQNVGYWCEDTGFADSADIDSYIPSSWI